MWNKNLSINLGEERVWWRERGGGGNTGCTCRTIQYSFHTRVARIFEFNICYFHYTYYATIPTYTLLCFLTQFSISPKENNNLSIHPSRGGWLCLFSIVPRSPRTHTNREWHEYFIWLIGKREMIFGSKLSAKPSTTIVRGELMFDFQLILIFRLLLYGFADIFRLFF